MGYRAFIIVILSVSLWAFSVSKVVYYGLSPLLLAVFVFEHTTVFIILWLLLALQIWWLRITTLCQLWRLNFLNWEFFDSRDLSLFLKSKQTSWNLYFRLFVRLVFIRPRIETFLFKVIVFKTIFHLVVLLVNFLLLVNWKSIVIYLISVRPNLSSTILIP